MQNRPPQFPPADGPARTDAPDFARIIENMPNLVYVFDHRTGANAYSNHSLGRMLGYNKEEIQALGGNLTSALIHPSDVPLVHAHFEKIRALNQTDFCSLTYRVRHKLGGWRWLFSQDAVYARDAEGLVTHHIGTATDITRQKQAERAALRAKEAARATNEELMQFSYAMSHDMKAPSNTMRLLLSELRLSLGPDASEDTMELLSFADETVAHMQTLVDDTLDFSSIIEGTEDLYPVALDAVMARVCKTLERQIHDSRAIFTLPPLPAVQGIEPQLEMLFLHLVKNALKFHRPGHPPDIDIAASRPDDAGRVTISVADDGIGIPLEKQSQIFHLFKRLKTDDAAKGTGLGLAICRRVAMNHGTQIALRSRATERTVFSIRLEAV